MRPYQIAVCVTILVVLSFIGISTGDTPFTPRGQRWEPAPEGHIIGKDNGVLTGDSGALADHFQGEDCAICHTPGGKAGAYVFSISGTVFKDKLGIEPLVGAEVIIRDVEGKVISLTSNEAGNFFTYAPIAHDPAAGSDPDTPRNWRYKSWVKYGESVRPMVTLAYVGAMAHYIPRMSCNMHHGRMGTRGTVSAGTFDTLAAYPDQNISFAAHVMPILKNRCKACHMPAATNPFTTYGDERFDYSGGLDLSAYAKAPGSSRGITDTINLAQPAQSPLLIRSLPGSLHSGGSFWEIGDPEYETIRLWIAEGASDN
ncbi:MAG: hypothetical protein QNJ22_04610 [Desulfosarcinaceae bacterium]|nr:hypothetical protein [Desulfosarcinaceae bacterium]